MKSIKLKNDKSIRGVIREAGTVLTVTENPSAINDDKDGLTIGILCAKDLIRRGDASETKSKTSVKTET